MINGLVNCVENRGRRRKRKTFVYNGIHCVADIDSAGSIVKSYTWGLGIDNLLAITCHSGVSTTTYYALTDLQGTVHSFADAGGSIVESYTYDAWGNVLTMSDGNGLPIGNPQSQIQNRFLFQGREYSWATGLYNFRLRWYDPATGRWLSKDPIGISGGLNLFAFCGNDPVNYRDHLGLCKDSRYNDRMAGISGAEALLESQHGALFNFFARFLAGVLRRGVQTAYQGELSGFSPSTAYGLGATQGVGESAFASATIGLTGLAAGELLGSASVLIPANHN